MVVLKHHLYIGVFFHLRFSIISKYENLSIVYLNKNFNDLCETRTIWTL